MAAQYTPKMQPLFVHTTLSKQLVTLSMIIHIRLPCWRPPQGGAIWTIRVFPDNRTARLRYHRREGMAVLPARIT
eukprot:7239772-Pyramimonas_sp.AAC.1